MKLKNIWHCIECDINFTFDHAVEHLNQMKHTGKLIVKRGIEKQ